MADLTGTLGAVLSGLLDRVSSLETYNADAKVPFTSDSSNNVYLSGFVSSSSTPGVLRRVSGVYAVGSSLYATSLYEGGVVLSTKYQSKLVAGSLITISGSTIYYGDVLSCSVSAIATYYSVNSSSYSSSYTVSGNLTVSPTATHVKCQAPTFSISSFSAKGGTSSNAVLSVTNHDLTATTIHYSVTIWPLSLSSTTNYYVGSGTFTVSPGTTVSHTIYTNNTVSVQTDNYVPTCDVTLYTTESGVTKSDSVTKYDSNLMSPYLTSSYVAGSTNKATLTIQNNTGVSVSYSCTSVPSTGTIRITGSGTLASGASVTLSGSYTSYYYSGTATVRFTYATHYTSVNSISYNNNYGAV